MIAVTEAAKEMLQSVELPEGQVLRLEVVGPQELGLTLGGAEPSDQIVEHGGTELIHISEEISQVADGATLDRAETPQGPTLIITPPPQDEPTPL